MALSRVQMFKSNRVTESLGRNGCMKTTGIDIYRRTDGNIELSPVTSKGTRGRCSVAIPKEDVAEVMNAVISMIQKEELQ